MRPEVLGSSGSLYQASKERGQQTLLLLLLLREAARVLQLPNFRKSGAALN